MRSLNRYSIQLAVQQKQLEIYVVFLFLFWKIVALRTRKLEALRPQTYNHYHKQIATLSL